MPERTSAKLTPPRAIPSPGARRTGSFEAPSPPTHPARDRLGRIDRPIDEADDPRTPSDLEERAGEEQEEARGTGDRERHVHEQDDAYTAPTRCLPREDERDTLGRGAPAERLAEPRSPRPRLASPPARLQAQRLDEARDLTCDLPLFLRRHATRKLPMRRLGRHLAAPLRAEDAPQAPRAPSGAPALALAIGRRASLRCLRGLPRALLRNPLARARGPPLPLAFARQARGREEPVEHPLERLPGLPILRERRGQREAHAFPALDPDDIDRTRGVHRLRGGDLDALRAERVQEARERRDHPR